MMNKINRQNDWEKHLQKIKSLKKPPKISKKNENYYDFVL